MRKALVNITLVFLFFLVKYHSVYSQQQIELLIIDEVIPENLLLSSSLELNVIDDEIGYIILDKGQKKIFHLSNEGTLIGTMGREGRGPGEMLRPSSVYYKDKKIFVYDRSLFRITIFSIEGTVLHSFSTSHHALDMRVSGNKIYLYYPFSINSIVAIYNLETGELIREFGEVSDVQKRLKAQLTSTNFQGIEIIDEKVFVLSHPYDLEVNVYDLDGNYLYKFHPESDIYEHPTVPENFNPFDDIHLFDRYVKSSIIRFYSDGQNNLCLIQAHFESGLKYLDCFDVDGSRLYERSINIDQLRPHATASNGKFYMLAEMLRDGDHKIGIQVLTLSIN